VEMMAGNRAFDMLYQASELKSFPQPASRLSFILPGRNCAVDNRSLRNENGSSRDEGR
jgi:hypothetical protein